MPTSGVRLEPDGHAATVYQADGGTHWHATAKAAHLEELGEGQGELAVDANCIAASAALGRGLRLLTHEPGCRCSALIPGTRPPVDSAKAATA